MKVRFSLKKKAVLFILMLALLLTAAAACVSYRVYSDTMDESYQTVTMHVAKTAASMVDWDLVRTYTDAVTERYLKNPAPEWNSEKEKEAYLASFEDLKDEGYQTLYDTLEKVKTANEVLSLYIIYVDPVSKTCVYIVDADDSETACPPGTWDILYEQNYSALEKPEGGFPAYITETEEFGWLCSAGAPIFDRDGNVIAYAMVDISMDQVMRERHQFLMHLLLLLCAITAVLIVLAFRTVNETVVRPINSLADAASNYVKEREQGEAGTETSALHKLTIHTGDEVENLYHIFCKMETDLEEHIRRLTAITAEKERIGAELSVATQIQADLLPSIFPPYPDRKEFDIYASMTPAREVGGDFYDFFLIDDDHLALVIADVSGKGIPAALFMIISKTLIKNHIQNGEAPETVFANVNEQLCESNQEGMFVTAWMAVLTLSTGKLTYVNAGHNPPFLQQNGRRFEMLQSQPGFVLAAMEGIVYQQEELFLSEGDTLFLYTDGVTEAEKTEEDFYGEEHLGAVLNRGAWESSAELIGAVREDVAGFVGSRPQSDDMTMLCVRYLKT